MKPQLRQGLITAVVVAAVALLLWSISRNVEYVEVKDWRPLSGEAKTNPLFASRLFLKGMGIPTETLDSLQSLTTLPDTDTVIVIDTKRYTQRVDQLNDILEWVESGGHLMTRSVSDWEFFDPDRSDSFIDENNRDENYESIEASSTAKVSSDPLQRFLKVHTGEHIPFKQKESIEIQLPDVSKKLSVGEDYYQSIVFDVDNAKTNLSQVEINGENFIIQQRVGQGMITLASDLAFIQNYGISDYDHAEIFWHLVHSNTKTPQQQPTAVWLIHSDDMPNLFQIIWKQFWPLCIMLGLLFLAWVLRVSRRFGPLIPKDDEDRRSLMEHVEASGNYYWKHKQQATLVDSTRAAVQQRLIQRIPGWQAMNHDQQATQVAERVSINEQQVLKLLHDDVSHNPHEFTEIIKQLEHIRNTV